MSWSIPLTDLVIEQEDLAAVADCLREGWLTMGPRTAAFEAALAEWTGSPHAAAVSSGTAALHLACRALGLGPGDEVVVPAFTFLASANAVRYCGAEPVLCDVESPSHPLLGPEAVERVLSDRTRAVMAVHFWGFACDVEALRGLCADRGLWLIEDAAQALGTKVPRSGRAAGTVGDAGCLSFFSKKQLCVGEGGMVLTADPAVDSRVRLLRSHGMTSGTWDRHRGHEDSYDVVDIGHNYRLDEPRAALGLSRLPRLADDITHRRAAVRRYRDALAGVPEIELVGDDEAVERGSHFAFAVLFRDGETRARVRDALARDGIQTTRYPALHTLSAYADAVPPGSLPHAEAVADRHLALPLGSRMTSEEVATVVAALTAARS